MLLVLQGQCFASDIASRVNGKTEPVIAIDTPATNFLALPLCRCLMVREGASFEVESLSELGIFGTFLSQGSNVLINKQAGHLVRTKVSS